MADHSNKQPQPVVTRAGIITALSVLSALLVHVGAGSVSTWLSVNSDAIAGAILGAGPLVSALLARQHVTPVESPRAADGTKLVPTGSESAQAGSSDAALEAANAIHPMDSGT